MQRKQKKSRAIGLLLGLLLGTSLFAYPTVYATEGEGSSEEPIVLTNVDTSKGVTYIYSDTSDTEPLGINLNGNSVIVVASKNSTDENLLNNIYIDKNMDGKIDSGDEQVSINDSVDINANYAIYGVYKQKTTLPISITVNSGYCPAIFGVYEGESIVKSADDNKTPAVSLTVNGGKVSSALFGVQSSTVTTDGVSASVVTINDGEASATVAAAMTAEINTVGATALVVHVNGGTVSNTVFGASGTDIVSEKAGAIETIMDTESESRLSTLISANNCTIKVKDSESAGVYAKVSRGNVGIFDALYGSTAELTKSTAPAVLGLIEDGSFSEVNFVYGSTVKSDENCTTLVDTDISGGTISKFSSVVYSDVDAGKNTNTVVDVDVTGTAVLSGGAYVVGGSDSWSYPDKDYTFVGNVDITFDFDGLPESGSNINSGYIVNSGAVIDGNVNITFNNARLSNVYGLYNAYVKGNYVFDVKDTCEVTSTLYAGYNPKVDGNATVDLVGAKESSYVTLYGFTGKYKSETTLVGGDVVVNYNGGYANNFYGLYGTSISSDDYIKVGKSVTVNVNAGTINSGYGVEYINAASAVKVLVKDTVLTGYIYTVYNVFSGGDITVDVTNNKNAETDYVYLYGAYYVNAAGNVTVNVDGGYYRGVQGVYGYSNRGAIGGDVEVNIKNVNKDSTTYQNGNYSYGAYGCKVAGKTTVNIENSNFYTIYGLDEVSSQGDVTVDISNVKSHYSIYAAEVKECGGNVTSTVENCTGNYVYGVYIYANCGGNITSTITDTTASQYIYGMSSSTSYAIDGDVNISLKGCACSSGYVYGVSGGTIQGNTIVTIEDGDFGKDNNYGGYLYGVSYANTLGETTVNFTDIDIVGSVYPYQSAGSSECADASVNITGLTMNTGSNTNVSLYNNTAEGQHVTTVIDDTSVIPENTYINPSSSYSGSGTLTYKDHLYLGGKVVFDKDVTYKNLHLNSGNYLIPKGVTVKVEDELYCEYGYILLEGTLDATFAGTLNDDGKIEGTYVYMNGGTLTEDLEKIQNLYYPFDVEYLTKGGTVSKTTSTSLYTHALRPGQYFVRVGDTVSYTIKANEGYSLIGATVQTEKSEAPVDAAVSGNTYSFVMEDSPTTFNVDFKGNQIVLGKTVADPVIKLNQEYTDENPIYDLDSVSISNDGLSGEVTFKVDPLAGLPEGLIIKDNKIFGVPTVAYEEGKKSIIHVTGKNDTVADLVLNMVVTEGNGTQASQDGRITIDETNAIVYLNGNSVVIETKDNNTAIYLDDNRDGVADSETALFVGDLTNYTMYGVRNSTAKDKLRITMNGGTIGTIYGAYNGNLVSEEHTLELYMNGGSVGALYALYDTITTGTMKVMLDSAATVAFTPTSGNSGYGGFYYNNKGTVNFYGTYSLKEDVEATNVYVSDNLTVEEGVTLSVSNYLYRRSGSRTYLKGNLSATKVYYGSSYYGMIVMQGGTLPENQTWSNVYYPVELSTDLKNTKITFGNNVISLTENGETQYYLIGGANISMSMTAADGYDYYISVDGGEYQTAVSGSTTFAMPRKAITLAGVYVPKQISVTKQFAEPEAIVNKEYTEASPLYDFASLKLTNDTTSTYGGEVKYALKSTSTLPEGLTFTGTKLIGTPTVVNEAGDKVTFVVTGRNGTTAEVDLTVAVKPEDYKKVDINDTVTISNSTINLNGTSVVIVGNPTSTSMASIYPDLNHDKIADNNIPLIVNKATSYDLSSYVIYGYTNTEKAYEGDISITMKGGNTRGIYGAYSSSSTEKVVINGDVSVSVEGGYINSYLSKVYTLYNGEADNVALEVTGGTHKYSEFIGAYNSTVKENINYTFGGTVSVSSSNYSSDYYRIYAHAAESSSVSGDINLNIGGTTSCFGSYSSKAYFYGAYKSTVAGNVNCKQVGSWYPGRSYLVYESTVGKNIDMDWSAGNVPYTFCALESTIEGDITVDAEENATLSGTGIYMLYNSTATNVYANIPKSVVGSVGITPYYTDTTNEAELVYVDNKGNVRIDGTYVIDKDMDISSIYTYEGSHVTVKEGVKIISTSSNNSSYVYGTFTNNGEVMMPYSTNIHGTYFNNGKLETNSTSYVYGTLDNYGEMKTTTLYIYDDAKVINRDMAAWEVASRVYNSYGGAIVNYGEFNQTYTSSSGCRYLGLVYTTKALNLYRDISNYVSSASYSTIYYPVTVDYPSQCVKSVVVSGDYVGSSGVEGDLNQYVQGGSTFTVTLGEQLMDTVTLQNVTYGSANTIATEQSDHTWQGIGVYEPFVVSANYSATDTVTKISLGKESDKIENTETATPLVVGTNYPYNSPLYDLTTIEILNDIEGDGTVAYSVDSSSTLPEGMYLKDGKLYGTLKKANAQEQVIKFVVRGKNQTSAFFTLTLGAVVKNVPEWTVPTGLTAVVGETLHDVYVPYSSLGTYSWPDATVSVGTEVTTLENVELRFTPKDVVNYDWETAAINAGATYADGVVTCKISIAVSAGKPTYTIPTGLEATYGQTFGDVPIDSGENEGTFTWDYEASRSVGAAGTHYYRVTYTPKDTDNYQTVSGIVVELKVNKATPTYSNDLTTVTQDCGITLADIVLPDAVGGKYQWITTATTIPINGTQYQAGYKPNDIRNYDWSTIEGWNSAWGCVVFPVTVYVNHTYTEEWVYDDDYHWHACLDETCESQGDKAEHEWVEGEIIEESTLTTEGSREYNCSCGAEKVVITPVLPHDEHTYSETWNYNNNCHWKECTFEGCNKTTMPVVHKLDDGVVDVEATDRNPGVKKYSCECGYYETEEIPQLPHTVHTYGDEWEHDETTHWQKCTFEGCDNESTPVAHTWDTEVVMTPATETSTGVMKYICICGEEKIETIPELEHTTHVYKTTWSYDEDEHWHECENADCDEVSGTEKHVFGNAQIIVAATEDDEGTRKYTCTTCGYSYTEQYDLADDETQEPLEQDEEFEDEENQITYMVTSVNSEVQFVDIDNKKKDNVTIPDTVTYGGVTYKVTSIADEAFKNHPTLKSIKMGDNIQRIGKKAFYGCKKLTSVTIGKNVTVIEESAFQNCTALKKITIPAGVITIGKKAFYGCKKLSTVKMGKNVQTIGNSAFQNCVALKKIEIPSKVKKIGSKAFYGCKKLTSITIKTTKLNTSKVGKNAFTKAGSSNYKKLTVKVPKKKKKAYKTMLKKRGLSSKAKIK